MRDFSATPYEMVASLWHHRSLITASAKREVLIRYRGSAMGLLWSFFNPVFMLAVYTFVFSEVLNARWGSGNESKTEFAFVLFAGLLVFNMFSESINRAPGLIVGNSNFVKKVIYPLEILPSAVLLSATYHYSISLVVWMVAYIFVFGLPHATVFLLPLIFIPFLMQLMGGSWLLASLGVYLRDVSQVISVITTVVMFLSPVFYPATSLPEGYRYLFFLNPITYPVEVTRDLLYWGVFPQIGGLVIYWLTSLVICWLGFVWFQKTRKGFADVL
jgi:lipopolysaccharide transport system permease protein